MNSLSEAQLAYIAGLFDGEGSVGIYYTKSSKSGKKYPKLMTRISNNNPTVLEWIKSPVV